MLYYLITYGKASGTILGISRRMTLGMARRAERNTPYLIDIVANRYLAEKILTLEG